MLSQVVGFDVLITFLVSYKTTSLVGLKTIKFLTDDLKIAEER